MEDENASSNAFREKKPHESSRMVFTVKVSFLSNEFLVNPSSFVGQNHMYSFSGLSNAQTKNKVRRNISCKMVNEKI